METVGESRASQAIAAAMSSVFGVGNSAFRTAREATMIVDTIPFPAYTRKTVGDGWTLTRRRYETRTTSTTTVFASSEVVFFSQRT